MSYKIKLENVFEDAYQKQRVNGFLSEFDCYGAEYDEHKDAIFDTLESAENMLERVNAEFFDNPELTIVEL